MKLRSFALAFLLGTGLLVAEEKAPWPLLEASTALEPLPGTEPLIEGEDIGYSLVLANGTFLDRRIEAERAARIERWAEDPDRDELRERFAKMLGLDRDRGPGALFAKGEGDTSAVSALHFLEEGPVAEHGGVVVHRVGWDVLEGIRAEGLLLEPAESGDAVRALVLAVPDADQSPEAIAGLVAGPTSAYAHRLAEAGCAVLVPTLVSRREMEHRMPLREWVHRPAFILGRHLLGYELQEIFAGLEALELRHGANLESALPAGIVGWGEGGLLALYAAALDPRFESACVSGYFGPREGLWKEPAEHNVFGLLGWFGDAELGALVSPRRLVVESGSYPEAGFRTEEDGSLEVLEERPDRRGKPGRFAAFSKGEVDREWGRLEQLTGPGEVSRFESDEAISVEALASFAAGLGIEKGLLEPGESEGEPLEGVEAFHEARVDRVARSIERHHQRALVSAAADRAAYWSALDTESLESFERTVEPYREDFRRDVIGDFELPLADPEPRSRPHFDGPRTVSYEVALEVYDGVFAYGILTLPRGFDLASDPPRPVVVCQHGLEGAPGDVIGEPKFRAYQAFATRLAERGYITFAPQNGYRFFDRFRLQQFKAQSIGRTLFSTIVDQHRQITDWLAAQRWVDAERIGFYGLSYGGKSAMRIPPLVDRYALSICSADFNEWVWKNAATDERSLRYSYANKGEYEIFEWNLGGTCNYAEMAALICPRPFMVERGHFDGVAPDETVGYEFAKVRYLYQAKLGIGDRCEIEWFVGPHAINGDGTFRFLDRHLGWTPE